MKEFDVYSPTDAVAANLQELFDRYTMLGEQELAHLRELADLIASASSLPSLLDALPDHRPPIAKQNEMLSQNEAAIRQAGDLYQTRQTVFLCRELCRILGKKDKLLTGFFFPDSEELPASASNRIIYQKNSYTNDAFLQFSARLPNARAAYAHSFPAACEAVYNRECEYCILPVENSAEGQLNGFFRLIERYELNLALSCEVFGNASERSTRFALLRRNALPIMQVDGGEYFFEFSLPMGQKPDTCDLLTAAQLCGLRLYRIDSIPHLAAESRFLTHYVFDTKGADLHAFLLYLAMEAPHYTPIGLYPHLSQKGIS